MCTAGFPEPQDVQHAGARGCCASAPDDFDVVHDNQVLGYGMLDIETMRAAAGHHASTTRSPSTAASTSPTAPTLAQEAHAAPLVRLPADAGARSPAQAAQDPHALGVLASATSSRDFGVDPARMQVILLGVDDGFVPPTAPRVPGRILAMASADAPMKGIATLLEAFAKLRTERDVELLLVTKPEPGGRTEQLIDQLGDRRLGHASSTASATPSWSS